MGLSRLERYLFPAAAEHDPAFRAEMLRFGQKRLSLLGWVEVVVAAFLPVISGRFWQAILVSSVGVLTVAAASVPLIRTWPRVAGIVSAWFATAALIWTSLPLTPTVAPDGRYILGEITAVLLAMVALLPLFPLHAFALGILVGLFYLASTFFHLHAFDPLIEVYIVMLTLLSTGLSAMLYQQRRSTYDAHAQALRVTADLNAAQSRALLAETAVSVGRLAASLTHELNSPLGALSSAADTMLVITGRQAAASPEEQEKLVAMQAELHHSVRQSVERLSAVIARLQQFVELENDEKRPADINELIKDASEGLQPRLEGNIRFELDLRPLPLLSCNPRQLMDVFSSLFSNAVNAIVGDGTVQVSTSCTNSGIEVKVEDNGRGMNDNEVETIFDPGFRVSDGRMAAGNWSLFSSRQIVHEHGGDIGVESREGAGTTVRITLPCA